VTKKLDMDVSIDNEYFENKEIKRLLIKDGS